MIKTTIHKIGLLFLTMLLIPAGALFSQVEMSERQWEILRDNYAVSIIKLMTYLDTLNMETDSSKKILELKEEQLKNCEDDLFALVGSTISGVADFRKKFEETEKRINSKTGTPADARRMYYDEISDSKIRCLPEFADRFTSMRKNLQDWEGFKPVVTTEGTYTVVKGDCLWRISVLKFGSPYYWPAIWEANKLGVVNKDELPDPRHKAITDPNLIYPGQVLRIPQLNNASKTESIERFKRFRKERLIKK